MKKRRRKKRSSRPCGPCYGIAGWPLTGAPIKINAFTAFLVTARSKQRPGSKLPRHLTLLRTRTAEDGSRGPPRHRGRSLLGSFTPRESSSPPRGAPRGARRRSTRVILFGVVLLGSFFFSLFSLNRTPLLRRHRRLLLRCSWLSRSLYTLPVRFPLSAIIRIPYFSR